MLLEVVEKLLALLIIMAMLILVMFLALPDSGKVTGTRTEVEPAPRERYVEQTPPPVTEKVVEPGKPSGESKVVVPDPRAATKPQQQPSQDAPKAAKQDSSTGVKTSEAAKSPKRQDRLPFTTPEPVHTVKTAREGPRVRTETVVVRQPAAPPTKYVEYRTRETRVYARPAQPKPRSRWDRTHYYECDGGRCDCSCSQPYWARSGPCWD